MRKFLIALAAIFAFVCCGHTVDPEPTTPHKVHRSVGKLTVHKHVVVAGKDEYVPIGGGTGFAIGEREIMTANHVCKALDTPGNVIRLSFYTGIYEAKFDDNLVAIKRDESRDLCILFMYSSPLKPIKFSGTWPKMGDKIFIFGAPAHQAFVLTSGYYGQNLHVKISGKDIWSATLSAPAFPGNSGSPVLNDKGEFIGVLIAGFPAYHHLTITPSYLGVKKFLEDR